jgi:hypothetical protein
LPLQEKRLGELTFARRDAGGELVEDGSTESSASISEGYPREFFLQPLSLSRVPGLSKPIHERKEAFLLGFLGLKAGLDQIYEYAIGACLPSLGQSAGSPWASFCYRQRRDTS